MTEAVINPARISYDRHGTPGIWAQSREQLWWGLGWVHAVHRPLQTLLIAAAARGELSSRVFPRGDLTQIDAVVRRMDLPGRAEAEAARLDETTAAWLDAYIDGIRAGLRRGGRPGSFIALGIRIAPPDRGSLLSALMLSAYLGLAEGQERMERAIVEALAEGADPGVLEQLFSPHLAGWNPEALRTLGRDRPPLGFPGRAVVGIGGSNAWAVGSERSASGNALLAGDPHLQIDQLPSLFLEVRARIADDYLLGASIPGLPGIAVGRNRRVAWSGTFSVADNVDFTLEEMRGGGAVREDGQTVAAIEREVVIRRRMLPPVRLRLFETDRGTLEGDSRDGPSLAVRWAASHEAAQAMAAYMRLPFAESADDAAQILDGAHTLSLHFVLADRSGETRYTQVGRIPHRSAGWSGLYPVEARRGRWVGVFGPAELPASGAVDGFVASANEARPGPGGAVLATLAQPPYRLDRIEQTLRARRDHDLSSMQALQLDLYSLQADRLLPRFLPHLDAAVRLRLEGWDRCYDEGSYGAPVFELAHRAVLAALADDLGGGWWKAALGRTEVRVWWAAALDRLIDDDTVWAGSRGHRMANALACLRVDSRPWGDVQQLTQRHMVLGGMPRILGLDRGPYALPGSLATVRQGNLVAAGEGAIAVGPAYRFVTDLGHDEAHTALAGGIDGSPRHATYGQWIDGWRQGAYHRIAVPEFTEEPQEMTS